MGRFAYGLLERFKEAEMERPVSLFCGLFSMLLVLFASCATAQEAEKPELPDRSLLMVVQTLGFHHASTEVAESIIKRLGEVSGIYSTTITNDARLIDKSFLDKFDAVLFYSTGELPISETGMEDFLDYIRSGKGFIGVHSATDTYYEWPEYGEMIGGWFDGHPWSTEVTINVEDTGHPATYFLGKSFRFTEEVYQYKNWSRDKCHVLLSLDNDSVDISRGKRSDGDYAMAWTKSYGKGRVFLNGLGHYNQAWSDKNFQLMVLNSIGWAFGDLPDKTPLPAEWKRIIDGMELPVK
jgi:type 1 glutamine amidotransferase